MVPFGSVDGGSGDSMSNYFSGQVPILFDLGYKPLPALFVGGYVGLGFGGASGTFGRQCNDNNDTCVAVSFHIGIEAQYSFAPDAAMNPWIGYGIGLESIALSAQNGTSSGSVSSAGWEYGHFMGGLDFRLSPSFGLGPFVDFSVGQYQSLSVTTNGSTNSGALSSTAMHEWLLISGRLVLFP
jgi:hypothetical protein